jgi:hypothetical protein
MPTDKTFTYIEVQKAPEHMQGDRRLESEIFRFDENAAARLHHPILGIGGAAVVTGRAVTVDEYQLGNPIATLVLQARPYDQTRNDAELLEFAKTYLDKSILLWDREKADKTSLSLQFDKFMLKKDLLKYQKAMLTNSGPSDPNGIINDFAKLCGAAPDTVSNALAEAGLSSLPLITTVISAATAVKELGELVMASYDAVRTRLVRRASLSSLMTVGASCVLSIHEVEIFLHAAKASKAAVSGTVAYFDPSGASALAVSAVALAARLAWLVAEYETVKEANLIIQSVSTTANAADFDMDDFHEMLKKCPLLGCYLLVTDIPPYQKIGILRLQASQNDIYLEHLPPKSKQKIEKYIEGELKRLVGDSDDFIYDSPYRLWKENNGKRQQAYQTKRTKWRTVKETPGKTAKSVVERLKKVFAPSQAGEPDQPPTRLIEVKPAPVNPQ